MDDQHQNVIDELARARQWRRSRSKPARPTSEATKARSDAPKRIADSLLVPAKMLTRAASVGDQLTDEQRSRAVAQPADPDPDAVIPDSSQPESAGDRNVFLEAGGAGSGGRTVTPASRWSIAASLTRLIGAMTPAHQSARPRTSSRATLRRMPMMRPNRPVTLALASLAAIAVAAVILTRSDTPS